MFSVPEWVEIVSMPQCPTCVGSGAVSDTIVHITTHEQAMDAGNMELEGLADYEQVWYPCPDCGGTGNALSESDDDEESDE